MILPVDGNALLQLVGALRIGPIFAEVTAPSANLVVDTAQAAILSPSRVTKAFSKLALRMPQHRINETSVRPQTQTS
jgi:hypothetical protein